MTETQSGPDLGDLLATLESGELPAHTDLTSLSSLDGDDRRLFDQRWPTLPDHTRVALIEQAASLAEDNALLDFVALARIALGDSLAEVRRLAAAALWESELPGVATDLVALLNDADESVRSEAALSLAHFVELFELGTLRESTGRDVCVALRRVAEDFDESPQVRAHAIEAVGSFSALWVEDLITTAFNEEDIDLRVGALRAMGASARDDWNEYILEALTADDPVVAFAAAVAAGDIASGEFTDTVANLLTSDDIEIVFAALRALGEIGGTEALAYLRSFQHQAGDAVTDEVAEAIEQAQFNSFEADLA